jgi:hypothetical protein
VIKKLTKLILYDVQTDEIFLLFLYYSLYCLFHYREEIEKQQAKANYQKMHIAGKTDEARADLARLAIIRKQREEAAKKRDAEKGQILYK